MSGVVILVFISIVFIVQDHRINLLQIQLNQERQDRISLSGADESVVNSIQYEVDIIAESLNLKNK